MAMIEVYAPYKRIGRNGGVFSIGATRAVAVAALTLLVAAAATLAWRRWPAGALVNPLEPLSLMAVAIATAAVAAFVRVGWSRPGWIGTTGASLAVVVTFVAVCVPGTLTEWIVAAALILAVEESWAWVSRFRSVNSRRGPTVPGGKRRASATIRGLLAPGCCEESITSNDAIPAEEVTQQLIRSRTADGREVLSGWLRTFFATGQRTGSVHVAFCPPLDDRPEVAVNQIAGPEARIRTAQALPYGVRLDLKLAEPAREPTGLLLQFSAASAREKPADDR
ncbi:MAG: hypothetical protein JW959_07890 [Pirellulales bacterium]|nr:hypothetical protein [Pirellulales bacterium]